MCIQHDRKLFIVQEQQNATTGWYQKIFSQPHFPSYHKNVYVHWAAYFNVVVSCSFQHRGKWKSIFLQRQPHSYIKSESWNERENHENVLFVGYNADKNICMENINGKKHESESAFSFLKWKYEKIKQNLSLYEKLFQLNEFKTRMFCH